MNTLCIVTLFFAAVFGLPIKTSDPSSFIDTTQEGATDELLKMIEQLRTENADAMEHATGKATKAQDEFNAAQDHLTSTTGAEDQALGNLEEGEKSLVHLSGKADGATAVEKDAAEHKAAADDAKNKAANFLASETERLDDEKATLEEVVELIETLAASAALQLSDSSDRKLLSIVDLSSLANADPGAVDEVRQLLLDLIKAGEDEREAATAARDETASAFEASSAAHKITYDKLAVALGKVQFQKETNVDLGEIAKAAIASKNAAATAHANAEQVLGNANRHLEEETARTESEEHTFTRVEALLSTLE